MSGVVRTVEATEAHFWSNVLVVDSCWEWLGSRNRGYGDIRVNGRTTRVHRYAYELRRGPIPVGMTIDHLCRNRGCVNPDHMEPVTIGENAKRGVGWAGIHSRKTHCVRGHALTPDNLMRVSGIRRCLTCHNIRSHATKARRRARVAAVLNALEAEGRAGGTP